MRGEKFVVDQVIVFAHLVGRDMKPLARLVDGRAVGEMAAAGEVQSHVGIARLQKREKHGLIGLGAGMRLHIGEGAVEKLPGAFDRQVLGNIHILAAAIVAAPRIALGIFVGQDRALGFQHGARHDILGGNQFDLVLLARQLRGYGFGDLGIGLVELLLEEAGKQRCGLSEFCPFHGLLCSLLCHRGPSRYTMAHCRLANSRPATS